MHLESTPEGFADTLRAEVGGRVWLVRNATSGAYTASSPRLQALADFLTADARDVRGHEAVFLAVGRGTGALFGAVLHSTRRGQAQGGVRHWSYATLQDFLRDGLRLSLAMTRKNALAQLWWGGGKGLIAQPPGGLADDPGFRRSLFREYGSFVTSLRGCYVTAEDVGTGTADMAEVARATRFATCIPPAQGGSGNPAEMTAEGVAWAMHGALAGLGRGDLSGSRVVLQGTGNVGAALIRRLVDRGVGSILAGEICPDRRDALLDLFSGDPVEIRLVEPGDRSILAEPCDVLAPCALGAVLGPKTIPHIGAQIVCGSANNPLVEERRDAAALADRGVTYIPDFVANRMGIVSCSNEQYGNVDDDGNVLRHLDPDWEGGIYRTTLRLVETAVAGNTTPLEAAVHMANALAAEPHPIWGHRGRRIVESLQRGGWAAGH